MQKNFELAVELLLSFTSEYDSAENTEIRKKTRVFKEKSLIDDETDPKKSLPAMIEQQVKDHETIITFIRKHLSEVEALHDGATADFLNKRLAVHEKMAWMLRSSL